MGKIKNKKTVIISLVLIVLIGVLCLKIRSSIQKNSILKVATSEDYYDQVQFQSALVDCFLFKKDEHSFIDQLAITKTVNDQRYLTGIKSAKFSDGSSITLQDVSDSLSLPEDIKFSTSKEYLLDTPLDTTYITSFLSKPIIKKPDINCGKYNILIRNPNETILDKNPHYTLGEALNYSKIVFRKIDLSTRNETDIQSDLIEQRIDVAINLFSPSTALQLVSHYPQLKMDTFMSPKQVVLLIKRDFLSSKELLDILKGWNIPLISKTIYSSTIVPSLDLDLFIKELNISTQFEKPSSKKDTSPKTIYFITQASSSLLRSAKLFVSSLDTSKYQTILQVVKTEDLSDFTLVSKDIGMILLDWDSSVSKDVLHQNGWNIYPLWHYQNVVISNKKVKDPVILFQ